MMSCVALKYGPAVSPIASKKKSSGTSVIVAQYNTTRENHDRPRCTPQMSFSVASMLLKSEMPTKSSAIMAVALRLPLLMASRALWTYWMTCCCALLSVAGTRPSCGATRPNAVLIHESICRSSCTKLLAKLSPTASSGISDSNVVYASADARIKHRFATNVRPTKAQK